MPLRVVLCQGTTPFIPAETYVHPDFKKKSALSLRFRCIFRAYPGPFHWAFRYDFKGGKPQCSFLVATYEEAPPFCCASAAFLLLQRQRLLRYALAESGGELGGFACIPGSHKVAGSHQCRCPGCSTPPLQMPDSRTSSSASWAVS